MQKFIQKQNKIHLCSSDRFELLENAVTELIKEDAVLKSTKQDTGTIQMVDGTSYLHSAYKSEIINKIKTELAKYFTEEELTIISKCGGFISGSFIFGIIMHIIHNHELTMPADIDIYLPESRDNHCTDLAHTHFSSTKTVISGTDYNTLNNGILKNCYFKNETNDMVYNLIYYEKKYNPIDIVNMFDLDCCKNYYTYRQYLDNELYIYDLEALIKLETSAKVNKYNYKDLYSASRKGLSSSTKSLLPHEKTFIQFTHDYTKVRMLIDVYRVFKNSHDNYPLRKYFDRKNFLDRENDNDNEVTVCAWDHAEEYKVDLENMESMFGIYKLLNEICNIISHSNAQYMDQNMLDLFNTVRCYYRIKKYESRGIKTFKIVNK